MVRKTPKFRVHCQGIIKHCQDEADSEPKRGDAGVTRRTRQWVILGCKNLLPSFWKSDKVRLKQGQMWGPEGSQS